MKQKAIDERCQVCGSWGFQRRNDGEFYCIACSMPLARNEGGKADSGAGKDENESERRQS